MLKCFKVYEVDIMTHATLVVVNIRSEKVPRLPPPPSKKKCFEKTFSIQKNLNRPYFMKRKKQVMKCVSFLFNDNHFYCIHLFTDDHAASEQVTVNGECIVSIMQQVLCVIMCCNKKFKTVKEVVLCEGWCVRNDRKKIIYLYSKI